MKILATFCSCLLLLLLLAQSTFTHATNAKAEIRQLSKIHLMAGPFGWRAGEFSDCSVSCGGGVQNRVVACVDLMTQQAFADTNCASAGAKPASSQACNIQACSGGTVNPAACAAMQCGTNTKCVVNAKGVASCVCSHGFGGTGCTTAPSITISTAVALPASAAPGTVLSMKWTTTGTIPTVQILLQDVNQPVGQYLNRSIPNTGTYSYTIPTTIIAGTYQFVIVPNIPDNTLPPSALSTLQVTSTIFTVTDQCTATGMTCTNGGTCIAGACSCPSGFTGTLCENPVCTPISCNSGIGTCDPASGACSNCKNGFHGLNCEIPASCPQTCNGNGTPNNLALCTAATAATTTCTCNGLWRGPTCNVCGLTCNNGGMPSPTCTMCMCPTGFSGLSCSQSTNTEFTIRLITTNETAHSSSIENDVVADLTFAANVSTSSLTVGRVVIIPVPATPLLNYFRTFATGGTANNVYLYMVMNDMTSTKLQSSMLFQSIQSQLPVTTSLLYSSLTSTLIDVQFGAQAGDAAPAVLVNNGGGGATAALQGGTLIALLTVTLLLFGTMIIVSGIMIYREKEKPKTREFRKDISDDIPDRADPFIQDLGNNRARIDATPYDWQPPRDASLYPYKPHQGEGAQYLRDFILGTNDGLLSTLLIVVGLVGGGSSSKVILLASIASAISGSIAMGLGEYIATKSQNEVLVGEEELDQFHFKYHRDREITLLRGYLKSIGIYQPILEPVVRKVALNDHSLMAIMKRFKFGGEANEDLERNPFKAMFMSGRLFFLGSLPSIFPFFINDPVVALWVALILSGTCLYIVGVYKTKTTGGSPWRSGLENLVLGAIAASLSFAVGKVYDEIRIAIGQ